MPSPIPPPDSHFITLAQFMQMKQAYADNKNSILQPPFQGDDVLCISELFNITAINAISSVAGCAGMRITYGMDAGKQVHAMMVAVDSNGIDILPSDKNAKFAAMDSGTNPPVVQEGQRCPPLCPP